MNKTNKSYLVSLLSVVFIVITPDIFHVIKFIRILPIVVISGISLMVSVTATLVSERCFIEFIKHVFCQRNLVLFLGLSSTFIGHLIKKRKKCYYVSKSKIYCDKFLPQSSQKLLSSKNRSQTLPGVP